MIPVTRFDGKTIILNADWIQSVEDVPDTLITLTTGKQILVRDSVQDIVERYKKHRKETNNGNFLCGDSKEILS